MTDGMQIALALTPTLTVLVGILINNRQIDSVRAEMRAGFASVSREFGSVSREFGSVGREFELTRELFTEKLLRVEEVMDARLKHIEEAK